ncbi:Gibberellin 20 oxidase 2 [Spatholobus suberectus]|nr:Gibberellin 20 oxidase 2 [Spatholobus suberectus]
MLPITKSTPFQAPSEQKLGAKRKPGAVTGYSGAHADRYSSKLPWKETFSFLHDHGGISNSQIVDYFRSVLGEDLQHTGWVYQKYCEAMKELSLVIMELLAISLGVDRLHYRRFFQDGHSIMRCNYYPPCNSASLTLGTGPHTDPTSLTILHQDQVGGLEVFVDNKWLAVRPRSEALVINIGDTFMALSNGRYKSCLHRALVNTYRERRSLVYFVCPREDKVVRPPDNLLCRNEQGSTLISHGPICLNSHRSTIGLMWPRSKASLSGNALPSHPTSSYLAAYDYWNCSWLM